MRQGGSAEHWSSILSETEPDVLFVQETKDPTALASDLVDTSPEDDIVWEPASNGRWGSALLFKSARIKLIRILNFEGWVVGGEVQTASHMLHAYSVHLPPIKNSYVKSANLLLDTLKPIVDGATLMLGGDFNLTVGVRRPGEERDNRRGELELLERMEEEFGVKSAWTSQTRISHCRRHCAGCANRKHPITVTGYSFPRAG